MARNRRSNDNKNDNKENTDMSADTSMFTPIEDEATLAEILAGARGRGDYKTVLSAFIDAGVRLAEIPLTKGAFEGKKAQTVKTGFENAKTSKNPPEGADKVKVVKRKTGDGDDAVERVYLVNQAVAA